MFAAGALLATPLGRLLKRAGPDALAQRLRSEFGVGVVLGIALVGDGVPLADHPSVQIVGAAPEDYNLETYSAERRELQTAFGARATTANRLFDKAHDEQERPQAAAVRRGAQ